MKDLEPGQSKRTASYEGKKSHESVKENLLMRGISKRSEVPRV